MIADVKFFDTPEELEKLTGLTHEELWDHGFNLDDMDWGLETNFVLHDGGEEDEFGYISKTAKYLTNGEIPCSLIQIIGWMENYCVGFWHTEYNGKQYYTLHHA